MLQRKQSRKQRRGRAKQMPALRRPTGASKQPWQDKRSYENKEAATKPWSQPCEQSHGQEGKKAVKKTRKPYEYKTPAMTNSCNYKTTATNGYKETKERRQPQKQECRHKSRETNRADNHKSQRQPLNANTEKGRKRKGGHSNAIGVHTQTQEETTEASKQSRKQECTPKRTWTATKRRHSFESNEKA